METHRNWFVEGGYLIQNNLFDDVNGKAWGGGGGVLFQVVSGADAVTIDHNTGFQSNQIIIADGIPSTNFVYQNNITPHNMYGVMGSGYASGISSLDHFFPGFVFEKNVIEGIAPSGVSQSKYPASTFFTGLGSRQFVNFANGNYALAPSSPVQECWDGRQGYRRRHRGAKRGNLFGNCSLGTDFRDAARESPPGAAMRSLIPAENSTIALSRSHTRGGTSFDLRRDPLSDDQRLKRNTGGRPTASALFTTPLALEFLREVRD